jgi:HD-GYP domain-containing protein (c-di-GMP phosphodiesterase class II)
MFDAISKIKIKDIPLSASCGTAIKTKASQNIEDVLIEAENDMYAQKTLHNQSSRNQVIVALFDSLKDKYEAERDHSDRVSHYCYLMGEKLELTPQEKLELEFAGRMHDIGKITIPDSILKKPGKLTDDEWVIMKNHTINGYQILRSADKYSNLADYALTHHERWDGHGYPKGLKGEDIPLFSRIIAIADAYEAMTADRPYRKAMDPKDAIKELNRCSGSQFDPELIKVFIHDVLSIDNNQSVI